jgi:hypothetical protein
MGDDDQGASKTPAAAAEPQKTTAPVVRGPALRRSLVKKLPTLDAKRDQEKIAVDPAALDLTADEFIEPLQALSERRT